ncbi:hypothetical protein HQ533_01585 [Candidatus Woesearchaeota archaeon]|nr:hypothetical protein [Candidatus Woesearchaeota archaeon]
MSDLEKIWDYQTSSKRYRTRAKYFTIIILYFLHVDRDYAYNMARNFKNVIMGTRTTNETKNFFELLNPSKISVLLNILTRYMILHKEVDENNKRAYYSLNYYGLAHFLIINYNKVHQISYKSKPIKRSLYDLETFMEGKDLQEIKIFNNVTYKTFQKLVFYYNHYSERLKPEDIIINITSYKKFDFYTIFLHLLNFLQTIYNYYNLENVLSVLNEQSVGKKMNTKKIEKNDLKGPLRIYTQTTLNKIKIEYINHYILKYYNNKEDREDIIKTYYNNDLKDLIDFIREATINSLLIDRE